MAQPDGPQSEPPPTTKQRLFRRFFGGSRHQNESSSQPPASLPSTFPLDQQPNGENAESGDSVKPHTGRHAWGSVVPGLPRAQTFKRQLSESRAHLAPVQPSIDEKRAVSMDRRFNSSRARASACPTDEPEASDIDLEDDLHQQQFPLQVPSFPGPHLPAESHPDTTASNDTSTGHVSATPDTISDSHSISDSEYEAQIRSELEKKWILNLSMHFKDRSQREKFFVTYRESEHVWRRVTVSLDYRDAPPNSLETDLIYTKFQRDKNQKIYEAIRESLPDIHFFDTVTNLKLETTDGRLHVHVVEDGNEIINYPPVSQVQHLGCRRIRESDVVFHSHMSGFVYKVSVGGQILIKKEIPSPETIEEFLYEINALNSLGYSENVINFHGVVVDEHDEYVKGLLISYADGGALIDVIYDNCKDPNGHGLAWEVRERWARQIVQGLADIHESGFVQGDFTLSNIVVDHKDDAKIIDINRRGCPVGWEPPEATPLLESNHRISMYIGIKSDLYQLGMVLWALAMEEDEPDLEGRPLFLGPEVKVPDWYRQLTETCLSPDPRRRLQASQLTQMFPPEASRRDPTSVDDAVSTGSYYADDYTVGRPPSEWSHYDPRYLPAGAPAYEPWNYAPRGRSPPSPLPSNPDLSESHRSVYSPTAWAARRFIRPSYSDAGVDDMRNDDINQTLTPTPTADRIVFPDGDLCIEPDEADGPEEDPLADATPTEAKDILSSENRAPAVSADVLTATTADTVGIGDDLSKTTIAYEAKLDDADLTDEGHIGGESKADVAATSGPLAEISPNIVSKDMPQEVEVQATKDSDELVIDKQPADDSDEKPIDVSSSADDGIPTLPTDSKPEDETSGAADTNDIADDEKPQVVESDTTSGDTEKLVAEAEEIPASTASPDQVNDINDGPVLKPAEDGQTDVPKEPKSEDMVDDAALEKPMEAETTTKETAEEAPAETIDAPTPADKPSDTPLEDDVAKDESSVKDVQNEPTTPANVLEGEATSDQVVVAEKAVEQDEIDTLSKNSAVDASAEADPSSAAKASEEEPNASPDAPKPDDVHQEVSPDKDEPGTDERAEDEAPGDLPTPPSLADDTPTEGQVVQSEASEHPEQIAKEDLEANTLPQPPVDDNKDDSPDQQTSEKKEVEDISDPAPDATTAPDPKASEEVIQEEETVSDVKKEPSDEPQPQKLVDGKDPHEPEQSASIDAHDQPNPETVTAPDQSVSEVPKATEADAQSTKDVEPTSEPPQPTDHNTNQDSTASVQPTTLGPPDSLAGIGSGLPDVQANLVPGDDPMLEDDFQLVSRSEPVST